MTETKHRDQGQANLTVLAVLLGLIVASVWIWKRLTPDTQDFVLDQAVPIAAIGLAIAALLFIPIRVVLRHRAKGRPGRRAGAGPACSALRWGCRCGCW